MIARRTVSCTRHLSRALHERYAIGVFVKCTRHQFVARRGVGHDPVADHNVSIIIVSMRRIIFSIIALVHPWARNIAVDEYHKRAVQVDTGILWG